MSPLPNFSPFGERRKYNRLDSFTSNNRPTTLMPTHHADEESLRGPSPVEMSDSIGSNRNAAKDKSNATACSARGLSIWKEITNVDRFLEQLYLYYEGKGLYVILLTRLSDLCIKGFV